MTFTILQLRAFARTKHQLDHAKRSSDVPWTPTVDLVMEVATDIIMEKKKEREEKG